MKLLSLLLSKEEVGEAICDRGESKTLAGVSKCYIAHGSLDGKIKTWYLPGE